MIVRNEEATLPGCLASVIDLVDEAVIVDTGSTDRTKEAARAASPKVKVVDYTWCDNFATARNEGLRHAKGDWIFWVDADDRVTAENRAKLQDLFAKLPDAYPIYAMRYVSHTPWCQGLSPVVHHFRLFRNSPDICWVGRVYERVLCTNANLGSQVVQTDIAVHHFGYADLPGYLHKVSRNQRLLQVERDETQLRLNWIQGYLAQHERALPILQRLMEIDSVAADQRTPAWEQERRYLQQLLFQPNRQYAKTPDVLNSSVIVTG